VSECIQDIIKDGGIKDLWKGLKASLILCVNPAITFGVFERIKSQIKKGKVLSSKEAFLIGAMSKTLATIVTCILC
jgi:solute carrier family 25 (peroxisomal adenine nucleotide transporter), member 17